MHTNSINDKIEEVIDFFKVFVRNSEALDTKVFDEHDRSSWGYYFRSRDVSAQKRIEAQDIVVHIQTERQNERSRQESLIARSSPDAHKEIDLLVNKHTVSKLLELIDTGKRRDSEINFSSWRPWEWRLPGKFKIACIQADEKLQHLKQTIDSQLEIIQRAKIRKTSPQPK